MTQRFLEVTRFIGNRELRYAYFVKFIEISNHKFSHNKIMKIELINPYLIPINFFVILVKCSYLKNVSIHFNINLIRGV